MICVRECLSNVVFEDIFMALQVSRKEAAIKCSKI